MLVCLAFTILLLSLPLYGQYFWNQTLSLGDNTPYCGTVINCLTPIGGNNMETKAGFDGNIYGLTSTHVLFTYTHASGWVQASNPLQSAGSHTIKHISVGSATQVLALSTVASPNNNVYVLDSAGTAWQALGTEWLTTAEIGPDGSVWGINSNTNQIYRWNGTAWTTISGHLYNISVGSAFGVWAVNSSGVLTNWSGTAWVSAPTPPFSPSHAKNGLAAVAKVSLALLDTSGGIHISTDAGNTWSTINGTASAITGAGVAMFTVDSSGASYHVNLVVPTYTNSGSGSWTCPNGGCPAGSYHTMTSTAKFGGAGGLHGTAGVSVQTQGPPTTYLAATATEYGSQCDPFYNDASNQNAKPHS